LCNCVVVQQLSPLLLRFLPEQGTHRDVAVAEHAASAGFPRGGGALPAAAGLGRAAAAGRVRFVLRQREAAALQELKNAADVLAHVFEFALPVKVVVSRFAPGINISS
jgi:ubiquinone biosynthesis protein COQ9